MVVLTGGALYLSHHAHEPPDHHSFHGEPSDLRSIPGIISAASRLDERAVIQLGLLLLIATPILRVALAVVIFAVERDWQYVLIASIVLGLLLTALISSQ